MKQKRLLLIVIMTCGQLKAGDKEYWPLVKHLPRMYEAGVRNNECKVQADCCCYPLICCCDCAKCAVKVPLAQGEQYCMEEDYVYKGGCEQVCGQTCIQKDYLDKNCLEYPHSEQCINCCACGTNIVLVVHQGWWEFICYPPKSLLRPVILGAIKVINSCVKGCANTCFQRDFKERQLKNQPVATSI